MAGERAVHEAKKAAGGEDTILEKDELVLVSSDGGPDSEAHGSGGPRNRTAYSQEIPVALRYKDPNGAQADGYVPEKVINTTKPVNSLEADSKKIEKPKNIKGIVEQEAETKPEVEAEQNHEVESMENIEQEVEETMNKETETTENFPVQAWISVSGLEMRATYRDIHVDQKEGYMVLFYHPEDPGLTLPKKGNDFEIKTEESEPHICRFTGLDFPVVNTELRAMVIYITENNENQAD